MRGGPSSQQQQYMPGFNSRGGGRGGFGMNIGGRGGGSGYQLQKSGVPHDGYVCKRCWKPGHFIHDCPTNNDKNYDAGKFGGVPKKEIGKVFMANPVEFMKKMDKRMRSLIKNP